MDAPAFTSPFTVTRTTAFLVSSPTHTISSPPKPLSTRTSTRAKLDLVPGIPPGQDPLDNAPLRYYVPRPVETYDKRSFTTALPETWSGEIETIGASDIPEMTKDSVEAERTIQVDMASTGAFLDYNRLVKDEREASLKALEARSQLGYTGRATCGEEEGKTFVSNYQTVLVDGVKAVEYWGVANGPVPRLFGGPTA